MRRQSMAEPEPESEYSSAVPPEPWSKPAPTVGPEPEVEYLPTGETEPEISAEYQPEFTPEHEPELSAEFEPFGEGKAEWEPSPEGEAEYPGTEGPWGLSEGAEGELGAGAGMWSSLGLYSLTIVLILLLNLLIIIAVLKGRLHRTNVVNIYLLSLIVSRMCIGVLVIPARITGLFSEEYLGVVLCKMCYFFGAGSGTTSVFSTTAIAIVKYREIVLHKGMISITESQAIRDVLIIWACGHAYAIRAPIMNSLTAGSCTILAEYWTINGYLLFLDLVVLFIGPLCIVVYCYVKVINYLALRNQQRRQDEHNIKALETVSEKMKLEKELQLAEKKPPVQPTNAWTTTKQTVKASPTTNPVQPATEWSQCQEDDRQKRRSINMILAVVTLFFVCTIIPYIPRFYAFWVEKRFDNFSMFETAAYLVSYSNPWANAMVIFTFRPDIRRALRLCCLPNNRVGNLESAKHMLKSVNMTNRDILLRTD